jgi:hypothetical protein
VTLQQLDPGIHLPDPLGRPGWAEPPFILEQPGLYRLTENVVTPGIAVIIRSPYVTLDLGGRTVSAGTDTPATAIVSIDSMLAPHSVVVRNGILTGRAEWAIQASGTPPNLARLIRVEDVTVMPKAITGIISEPALHQGFLLGPMSRVVRCRVLHHPFGAPNQSGGYPDVDPGGRGLVLSASAYVSQVEMDAASISMGSGSFLERASIKNYKAKQLAGGIVEGAYSLSVGSHSVVRDIVSRPSGGDSPFLIGQGVRLDDFTVELGTISGSAAFLDGALVTRMRSEATGLHFFAHALRLDDVTLRGRLAHYQGAKAAHFSDLSLENTFGLFTTDTTLVAPRGSFIRDSTLEGGSVTLGSTAFTPDPLHPEAFVRIEDSVLSGGRLFLARLPVGSLAINNRFTNIPGVGLHLAAGGLVRGNLFANEPDPFSIRGEGVEFLGVGSFLLENQFHHLATAHSGLLVGVARGPWVEPPVFNADLSPHHNAFFQIHSPPSTP